MITIVGLSRTSTCFEGSLTLRLCPRRRPRAAFSQKSRGCLLSAAKQTDYEFDERSSATPRMRFTPTQRPRGVACCARAAACRAGPTTAYSFGAGITKQQANFEATRTVACGSLPANQWGSAKCTATSGSGARMDTRRARPARSKHHPAMPGRASCAAAAGATTRPAAAPPTAAATRPGVRATTSGSVSRGLPTNRLPFLSLTLSQFFFLLSFFHRSS